MSAAARVQAMTVGHALNLHSAGHGVVHSVFARAVNLAIRADLWTLLAQDRADLPLGIRVPLSGFDELGLRGGERVSVRSGFVGLGSRLVVDCRAAPRWVPARQGMPEPGLERRLAVVASAAAARSWHQSARMARAVRSAVKDPTGLGEVLAGVVGRGPGATPSGDDVLVGVLAVLTSPHSGSAGARAAASIRRTLVTLLPTTTEVSGHLLRQAANGLLCRDVCELVSALLGTPSPQQLGEKVCRVIEAGATSGADTCEGLLAFAPAFFTTAAERASP